jgi:hypothetical protein
MTNAEEQALVSTIGGQWIQWPNTLDMILQHVLQLFTARHRGRSERPRTEHLTYEAHGVPRAESVDIRQPSDQSRSGRCKHAGRWACEAEVAPGRISDVKILPPPRLGPTEEPTSFQPCCGLMDRSIGAPQQATQRHGGGRCPSHTIDNHRIESWPQKCSDAQFRHGGKNPCNRADRIALAGNLIVPGSPVEKEGERLRLQIGHQASGAGGPSDKCLFPSLATRRLLGRYLCRAQSDVGGRVK